MIPRNSNHFLYNSVSGLNYTVKIAHKVNATGQVLRWGDTNEDGKYEESTTTGEPIYVITSIGRNSGAAKSVRIEAARTPPITSISALYTKSNLVIKGSSTYISGNEGTETGPGVISKGSITENGSPTVLGDPPTEPNSAKDIDVGAMIDANRAKANYSLNSTGTMTGMNWGTPTAGATPQSPLACATDNVVYINGNVKLAGGTMGCGMLMVDGNLELNGGFQWYGPILVRGSLSLYGRRGKERDGRNPRGRHGIRRRHRRQRGDPPLEQRPSPGHRENAPHRAALGGGVLKAPTGDLDNRRT